MSSEGAGSFQVCQPVRPVLGGVYRRSPSSPPVRRGGRNTALERGYEPIRGVVAFALILLFYQVWRMGVRFDDHSVRIRQFLRTDRFGWPEVSHFADGRTSLTDGKDAADFWACIS